MTRLSAMPYIRRLYHTLCLTSAVGLLTLPIPVSLADEYEPGSSGQSGNAPSIPGGARAYTPPSDSQSSGDDHTGGGVRGCGDEIVALAPRLNFAGQSLSRRPTFVWYSFSRTPAPMEFQLYEYQPNGSFETVLTDGVGDSEAGYMAYTLPEDHPDLTVGNTYLWQVVMYCDENLEEVVRWTSADIEIVDMPTRLTLEGLSEGSVARAQAYAAVGLWYDALAIVYDGETPDEITLRRDLLLDLADLEEQPDNAIALNLSEQLREIAEMSPTE